MQKRLAMFLGWQLGVLAAALLTPLLIPYIGWRGMFMVGIIPAFVAWFFQCETTRTGNLCTKQRGKMNIP